MKEKVIISISGLQVVEETDENVEVISPGKYFYKNEKHYMTYEEVEEESQQTINNIIKAYGKRVDVIRKGLINTKMSFEEGKTTQSIYSTQFGELLLETKTDEVVIEEYENSIHISIKYELFINNSRTAINDVVIRVKNISE